MIVILSIYISLGVAISANGITKKQIIEEINFKFLNAVCFLFYFICKYNYFLRFFLFVFINFLFFLLKGFSFDIDFIL